MWLCSLDRQLDLKPLPRSAISTFTLRALQGDAVLRWEYLPGSTFFVVWQQQRSGYLVEDGIFRQRDVTDLCTDPGQNVFLLKFSYWFAR